MNPTMQQVISFLEDEGLGPIKIGSDDPSCWKIKINDVWTADSKMRCAIALVKPEWSSEPEVLFNTYKSYLLYGDDYKGTFWKFVMMIKEMSSINEAKIYFMSRYMLNSENIAQAFINSKRQDKIDTIKKSKEHVKFPKHFERLDLNAHEEYIKYLFNRKLSMWKILELPLFVDPKERRVIFPVYENGEMIFWTGRSINLNSKLTWKNATCSSWPHPIWNLDAISSNGSVCIFEAIFDAAVVHNGIAILGASNIQNEQISKIISCGFSRIIVVMDNDAAGEKTRMELAQKLSEKHNNVWIYDFKGIKEKDFNEMAQNGIDFNIDERIKKYSLKTQLAKRLNIIK
jgi:5S rRNA maturation endonuclease (ribonuclease M5)